MFFKPNIYPFQTGLAMTRTKQAFRRSGLAFSLEKASNKLSMEKGR